jgi:hypothetical protein
MSPRRSRRSTCTSTATRCSQAASARTPIACPLPSARCTGWRCARPRRRAALNIFLGTDSAPHAVIGKGKACGCAGCSTRLCAGKLCGGVRRRRRAGQVRGLCLAPRSGKPDPRTERDAAVAAALDDPIMADPDLASQNRGNTALSGGGPAMAEVPPDKRTPEEAERARTAAQELLGGRIASAPTAAQTLPESRLARAVTMQGVAQALGLGGAGCPAKLGYGFIWAARLPAGLPVYPRGHTRVAAGADDAACKVRVVRFASPASVADLTDFYYASARGVAPFHSKRPDRRSSLPRNRRWGGGCPKGRPRQMAPPNWRRWSAGSS